MAKKKKKVNKITSESIENNENVMVKSAKSKNAKEKNKKKNTKKRKIKQNSRSTINDLTKAYAPKNDKPSTIAEELSKVTSIKSKEQVKKPKNIVLMVCFYVTICLAISVFCFIRFSRINTDNKYKEMYEELYKEVHETTSMLLLPTESNIIEKSVETVTDETETIEEIETTEETKEKTTKEEETSKEIVTAKKQEGKDAETTKKQETSKINEIIKRLETAKKYEVIKEETKAAPQETIKKAVLSNNARNQVQNNQQNGPALLRIMPHYDRELYSPATFYQYNDVDIKESFAQLSIYYDKIKSLVFGENVSFDDKGTNGILYLNYTYLNHFLGSANELMKNKYAALVDVQTSDRPIIFDFRNAKDMGMYYEIPANDGTKKLNLMVLKKAKVGFLQNFNLTTTLEILDIECNTRHNPYFDIEDVVGEYPKIRDKFKETAFNLNDMLYGSSFNMIRYDKKGYITDIFLKQ